MHIYTLIPFSDVSLSLCLSVSRARSLARSLARSCPSTPPHPPTPSLSLYSRPLLLPPSLSSLSSSGHGGSSNSSRPQSRGGGDNGIHSPTLTESPGVGRGGTGEGGGSGGRGLVLGAVGSSTRTGLTLTAVKLQVRGFVLIVWSNRTQSFNCLVK